VIATSRLRLVSVPPKTSSMAWTLRRKLSRFLRRRRGDPVILMYHRIADADLDPWELAVRPAAFEKQMRDLASTRSVLPLDEFVSRHLKGNLPSDAAAITFDDGYACNALLAAPLLEALGLPATFFLATGMLGKSEEFWNDALERVVFDPAAGGPASVVIAGRGVQVDLGTQPEDYYVGRAWRAMQEPPRTARQRAYLKLWEVLKPAAFDLQYQAIESLARQVGSDLVARKSHRPMTTDEARTLSRRPSLDISAHTHTHISLPLWDRDIQLEEIRQSRRICEALSCRPCTAFAYPYGDFSDLTIECAKQCGLMCAVSAYPRSVASTDLPLTLPRIMMRNQSTVG
jgi:peptidoglycan/xylan/chitin deacetylase (PgdA/CDA1 family)